MDGGKFLSTIDGLTRQNRILGLCLVVMFIWNLTNWGAAKSMQAKTTVVVVPLGDHGLEIGAGKASDRYMRRMSRYISQQLGSYTAATARQQYEELLELFPADRVGSVQDYFEKIATDIERFPSISSSVRWVGEDPLKYDDKRIQVQAEKQRLVNGSVTERTTTWYCIDYRIDEARFWLLNIEEKVGTGDDLCFLEAAPAAAQ